MNVRLLETIPKTLDPFRFLLFAVAGWMNQQQQHAIDYLREENRIPRAQLGKRRLRFPVIFTAVSRDGDHGYVFVQSNSGPCIACLFPDIVNDDRYPCPGTPAIADILQAVGALSVYAIDTLLMKRPRTWNYRRISLADPTYDGGSWIPSRAGCHSKWDSSPDARC